jgi:hypothetical protein
MGYATVQHVPPMRTYEKALSIYEEIKPMRGRPDVRPLGQRRDADTYSIRLNAEGDVECVLYQTPVVTFKKDGDVVLYAGGWHTVATNQFIGQVLTINVNTSRGNTIVDVGGAGGSAKYVISGNNKLTLRRGTRVGHPWDVMDAQINHGYKLNKVAANNVRATYKEFSDYMNNICKLRVPSKEHDTFEFMRHELEPLNMKFYYTTDEGYGEIMELVQSKDTEKFHRAFLLLVLESLPHWYRQRVINDDTFIAKPNIKDMKDALRHVILRTHAKEVLERIELPQGKLPNPKYRDWIKD